MPKNLECMLEEQQRARFEQIFHSHTLPEDVQKLGIARLSAYARYIVAIVDVYGSKPAYWSYFWLILYADLEREMAAV